MKISMSKKLLSMLLVSTGLAAASVAHASDGTITFTGSVIASTCKINGGAGDLGVALPMVSTTSLAANGNVAGRTPFTLSITGCTTTEGSPTKIGVVFEAGANTNMSTGRLTVDAGTTEKPAAKNVEINVLDNTQSPVKVGSQNQGTPVTIGTDGTAQLSYFAEYYATDKATAGVANSKVQYSLTYQ